jgi:SAM-dependent methyltransferase
MRAAPCHSCGHAALEPIASFDRLHRVASDCRPWPGRGELAICRNCGLVQKPVTEAWHKDAADIYAGYHMYHQVAGEAEQKVASDGGFEKRSDVLLTWAKGQLALGPTGRHLDFGCGNGATLRAAAHVLRGWELFGYEPHIRNEAALRAIPGVRDLLTRLDGEAGRFDLITMMHVVEHIPNPAKALMDVAKALAPGGHIFIQVPYFIDSPYELTVADHCSHFTVAALKNVVMQAGLDVVSASSDVLKREITLVAKRRDGGRPQPPIERLDAEAVIGAARDQVTWLNGVVDHARVAVRRPFGIFGTAIAGSWLYSHLAEVTDFFVDEDVNRAGREFLDRPVYLPSQVPDGATVYVALIPELARKIAARHTASRARWLTPPDWHRPEIDRTRADGAAPSPA